MKKLFLIIAILASSIANAQMTKEDFKTKHPKVKTVEVKSDKLEMGYEDQFKNESDPIAYKVNGIYVKYDNKRWFIPFNNIQSIDPKKQTSLLICLKDKNTFQTGLPVPTEF